MCINIGEINEFENNSYAFSNRERDTCVNSSGIKEMFCIPYVI